MDLKESVIFALRQAKKNNEELVVGKEGGKWLVRPMADHASDALEDSIIITPEGFKYPHDEANFYRMKSLGE